MAVTRPALSTAGCSQCRLLVLSLFTSNAVRASPIARPALPYARARVVGALPIRSFSSLPKSTNPTFDAENVENAEHVQSTRILEEEEQGNNEDKDEVARNNSKAVAGVPWYLQVEPPTYIAPLEPPPLPETPPDSPAIIRSLLEYASEEMGLDSLNLLDLRELDPPPALGPNLFMLFGTARSERHLNVSAGRLVRWLRAKHRVHADADGLLGPNERKTKLRRLAKRAKLLGTMGTDNADDGIRTGWICVNLGTIDRGGAESTVVAEDGRVSGFGVSQAGSTIVFQIMTEARRAEMGLEELWTKALDRALSPSPTSGSADSGQGPRSRKTPEKALHPVEEAIMANLHRPSGSPSGRKGSPNQARFYSTLYSTQQPLTPSIEYESADSSAHQLTHALTYDAHQKQRLLELLMAQLDTMDAQATREALGKNETPSRLTSFVELMQLAMETLPIAQTWKYRLAVHYKASVIGLPHISQSMDDVRLLVEELRVYGIQATRDQYLQLLFCLSCIKPQRSEAHHFLTLDVINTMQQRNESILTNDLIVTIMEGISNRPSKGGVQLMARLSKLLVELDLPYMGEQLAMRLMTAYANQADWNGVWDAWGIPPRNLRGRSADMYIRMYELAAATSSVEICEQVLRRCSPESAAENPPLLLNKAVSQAALKCIHIADPFALQFAEKLSADSRGHVRKLANREFVKLARLFQSIP
ncbi:hypothetical protein GGR51DRAFT_268043 [Nemania sp. FL0031]|nr:hypothetical protein GGR51DRAFT_268043 [Nemania sp. FL0031]